MNRSIACFGFALLLSACGSGQTITLTSPEATEITLRVEIADTPEERAQGLMHRKSMPQNAGMLFLMPEEQEQTFWMKNTLIPLDILFFNAEGTLVSVRTMQPCEADPCPGYTSGVPALYALELNAGAVERLGIGAGWKLVLPTTDRTSPNTPEEQSRP